MRKPIDNVDTQVLRKILLIAIAKRNRARFPAATLIAAWQRADGMNELMVGVSFPMRRFASSCHDHAWPVLWTFPFYFDCRCQMH